MKRCDLGSIRAIQMLVAMLLAVLSSRAQVTINWPLPGGEIKWFHQKNLGYIERDSVNEIWIEAQTCPSRNLVVALDTAMSRIRENWTPIVAGKKLNEPLAIYTMAAAEQMEGVKRSKNGLEYVDNASLYWVKGFFLTTLEKVNVHLTLYCQTGEGLELVNNLDLEVR